MTTSGSSVPALVGAAVLFLSLPVLATAQVAGGESAVERECALSDEPETSPPVSTLADSATLTTTLSELHPDVLAQRYGLYSVRFDDAGAVQWIAQLRTNVPEEYQDTVSATLSDHLTRTGGGGERGVRLGLVLGPESELVAGPPRVCPPVRREQRRRLGTGSTSIAADELDDLRRAGQARLRVQVSPSGTVRSVQLLRSSGSSVKDDMALEAMQDAVFAPALQDGVPVEGRLEIDWGARGMDSF